MNKIFVVVALVAVFLLNDTVALRGALFRSGRSLLRQSQSQASVHHNEPHLVPMGKRTPIVELYPVVDTNSESFPSYFRF